MSFPNTEDLTLCTICCDSFDSKERCPHMLTCGHTFCHSCLQEFISRGSDCSTCRAEITYGSAKEVPINYFTIGYVESLRKNNKAINEVYSYNGYCDSHFLPNHLKCLECNKFICGLCHFLLHRSCLDVFLVLEAKKKELAKQKKKLKEGNLYVTKNEEKKYAKVNLTEGLITFDEWKEEKDEGSYCIDVLDFINSRTTVIDTHKFIMERKEKLHYPTLPKDKIKFSHIEVKGREVYFNSFKTSGRRRFALEFGSLLKTLGCSYVIPAEAFMKPSPRSSSGEEIVVTTDGKSPRALNFLLLSSGIMDDSYKRTQFGINDSIVYGGFKYEGNLFPGVVEGIRKRGFYENKEVTRGDVEGWFSNDFNELSAFGVCKEDSSCHSTSTFGRVKRGMEVVDQIEEYEEPVKECGLLFNLI